MNCTDNLDCIKTFLEYPQELLIYTHKIYGYNKKISTKDYEFLYEIVYMFKLTYENALEFIKLWNDAPKYCCLNDTPNPGRCTSAKPYCFNTGRQTDSRKGNLDCKAHLEIRKKAKLNDSEDECLEQYSANDCCGNGEKRSWRDPFKWKCINNKCVLVPNPNAPKTENRFKISDPIDIPKIQEPKKHISDTDHPQDTVPKESWMSTPRSIRRQKSFQNLASLSKN